MPVRTLVKTLLNLFICCRYNHRVGIFILFQQCLYWNQDASEELNRETTVTQQHFVSLIQFGPVCLNFYDRLLVSGDLQFIDRYFLGNYCQLMSDLNVLPLFDGKFFPDDDQFCLKFLDQSRKMGWISIWICNLVLQLSYLKFQPSYYFEVVVLLFFLLYSQQVQLIFQFTSLGFPNVEVHDQFSTLFFLYGQTVP